jgi:hypothetical protein
MTGIEIALAAASAAATAYGAVSSAQAQRASSNAQAQAADYNATVSAQNADIARNNAAAMEEQQRQQSRALLAKGRAAAATSGFDSATGTLDLLQQQNADRAELDAHMIRYRGELEARGYSAQSVLDTYGGAVSRMNASAAGRAGNIGAASALISGAANYGQNSLMINSGRGK